MSLINPEDTTLEEIREKSLIWQKMKSAISHGANWVISYRDDLTAQETRKKSKAEPIPAEEEGPDLQGLREEIYDLLDEGDQIYAPALSNIHEVPLDVVETMIAQAKADWEMEAEKKRKQALMNEYDDLTSEGRAIWQKHLKRFISWKGLYDEAQSNWIALKDSMEYSPQEDSEESLKLQVAIWKNFKADLDYTARAINNEASERGNIWLLKLFVIDVESKPDTPAQDVADTTTDAEPIPAEEGDLEGLRKNLARVFDIGVTPNAEVQSNMHHVPLDVVEAEIEKAKASRGMESSEPAAETDDADQKRSLTMEEVEFLYAEIEGEIGDLSEPEQVEVRQFLKVNYDAYPTYQWRDMLKIDALETLAETLDQIDRGIKEKGVEAFKLSDPPLVSERTEPEQPAPLLSYPEATGQQILNCKGGLSELIEAEGIPLVIKFAAEDFLETIEKHLLTKDREDA